MNLDNLLKEMKEKMQERDLSDKYLEENRHMTRTEMGIGEYGYGITTVPCEWVYDFLSDYKRVLKENEEKTTILLTGAEKVKQLQKEKEELKSEIEKRKHDNETLKNFVSAIFDDDFENKYISKQEANEYKKEIEQLHEQIDKMNSFMDEKTIEESGGNPPSSFKG